MNLKMFYFMLFLRLYLNKTNIKVLNISSHYNTIEFVNRVKFGYKFVFLFNIF